MTQQNASLVEQAAAASEAMGAQAQELSDLVSYFNLGSAEKTISVAPVQRLTSEETSQAESKPDKKPTASLPPSDHFKDENNDGEWKDF